jgi:hypothetical protein
MNDGMEEEGGEAEVQEGVQQEKEEDEEEEEEEDEEDAVDREGEGGDVVIHGSSSP